MKVRKHLLNLAHPDGGSKAVWFHSLGVTRDDWTYLAAALLAIARNCERFDTETTRFGVEYKTSGTIGRDGHSPGPALTVWIAEDGDPPRLFTAYPKEAKCLLNTRSSFSTPN